MTNAFKSVATAAFPVFTALSFSLTSAVPANGIASVETERRPGLFSRQTVTELERREQHAVDSVHATLRQAKATASPVLEYDDEGVQYMGYWDEPDGLAPPPPLPGQFVAAPRGTLITQAKLPPIPVERSDFDTYFSA